MNCPNCNKPLTGFAFIDVQLDECTECGGIWFDADELRRTQHAAPDAWAKLEAQIAPRSQQTVGPAPAEKKCPKCGTDLLPYRYMANSDVHLDECEQCGGTWVDDGELAAMSEFLQRSLQEVANNPTGQLTPDELARIRQHLATRQQPGIPVTRPNYVADTLSMLTTMGRWHDPFRFEGWFGPDT